MIAACGASCEAGFWTEMRKNTGTHAFAPQITVRSVSSESCRANGQRINVSADYQYKLDLRTELIPRSSLVSALEQQLGRRLTHEQRYYLNDRAVHCGDLLELYRDDHWVAGRYEWTGSPEDKPLLYHEDGVTALDETSLLRWPVG